MQGGASVGMVHDRQAARLGGGHIGWDAKTYGYHSDDGSYWAAGRHGDYSVPFGAGKGDVVGCGVTPARDVFFTLNGQCLGNAWMPACNQVLYPAVALHEKGDCAWVNLGSRPFEYDAEWHWQAVMQGHEVPTATPAELEKGR